MYLFSQKWQHTLTDIKWSFGVFQMSRMKIYYTLLELNIKKNLKLILKGHWTTSASSPDFFFKKVEIFIPLEVYTYVMYAQSYLQLQLSCKDIWIFLSVAIFDFLKWLPLSWLLNLAPSTIILVWRKFLKLVCAIFWTDRKVNWTLCKLRHYG